MTHLVAGDEVMFVGSHANLISMGIHSSTARRALSLHPCVFLSYYPAYTDTPRGSARIKAMDGSIWWVRTAFFIPLPIYHRLFSIGKDEMDEVDEVGI